MAAPTFGSLGTQTQPTASTVNVDVPDGVVADSLVVVTMFVDCATTDTTVTGMPSGFSQAPDSPVNVDIGASTDSRLYVMWKRATTTESTAGTYSFTLSAVVYSNAAAIRYDGVITSGDPWDVTASAFLTSPSTSTAAVSDTTTVADTLLVWSGTSWNGGTWTPPTSFTERRDSGDGVCTVADLAQATAGSTGSLVGTVSVSGKGGSWLGALKSASVVADTSIYTPARLPGLIGPDGKIFAPTVRYDDVSTTVPATQAPAGDAEGTASAFPATAALGITPGTATASSTGLTATSALGVNPGTATAAGSALQATVSTSAGTNAPAGLASVTGTAFVPTIAVGALPATPTAMGAANQPAVTERVNAGTATAAGSAPQPNARVGPVAGAASGTGSAFTASTAIRGNADIATANGVANQPTVSISGSVNAPAGVASAAGAALSPQVAVAPVAATPTATGTALAGRITLRVLPGTATADGVAFGIAGPIQPVTPYTRTYYIPADLRELEVLADNRTYLIPADARTFTVPGDEEA